MTSLPNGSLIAGADGWTVLTPGCAGVTWRVDGDRLVVDSRECRTTPSGSIVVFTPRRRAAAGTWRATATLTATPPITIDVGVVGAVEVPVPGPPPQAPAYTPTPVAAAATPVSATRELDATARTVGARFAFPPGGIVTVEAVDVVPGARDAALDGDAGLHVGFPVSHAPFSAGALLPRGTDASLPLTALVSGDVAATLTVVRSDQYAGTSALLLHRTMPAGSPPLRVGVARVTATCGAFAVVATLATDLGERQAVWRYVVDDDADELIADQALPWGLTAGTDALDASGPLLRLLGVGHTRVYSGFAAWDLPATLDVTDPGQAAALLDGGEFVGLASGTPAMRCAADVAGRLPGQPTPGWPAWRRAAAVLASAPVERLRPRADLLDDYAGLTVVAEMSQLDDPAGRARVTRTVAAGLAGRGVAWSAQNEPDLGDADRSPEAVCADDLEFAAAVRAGDPEALVVGPMLADGWDGGHQGMTGWDWLERWVRAGGGEAVDAVSLHLHMLDEETQAPEREDLEGLLHRCRDLLDRHSVRAPLWVTEMGWRSAPVAGDPEPGESGPAVCEADQADLLVRAAVLAAGCGVERFLAFQLTGFRSTGGGHRFAWGVVDGAPGGPKPAFAALRRLCRVTAGARDVRLLATARRVRAVVFTGATTSVAVVWHYSGGPSAYTLGDLPDGVTVTSLLGAPAAGDDLRRPHLVSFATSDTDRVTSWLTTRLRPRHGEPMHDASAPVTFRHKEMAHVPS